MKRLTLLAATLVAAAVVVPAHADDDTGPYAGISVNRLSTNEADVRDVRFRDSDNALGLKFGYLFDGRFGLEGGYLDLGDYRARGGDRGADLTLDVEGYYLVGVYNHELAANWDVYGKLGVFAVDTDSSLTGFNRSSTEPYGGIGVEYDFGDWNLFGEYTKLDTDVDDLTIDAISLGVKYEFPR